MLMMKAISKINKQIESIEDMHRFIESFPEFRQQSGSVAKHVNLMSELSKTVTEKSLMIVSQAEQEVVCGTDRMLAFDLVMELLADRKILHFECFKLALLFILRYGADSGRQMDDIVAALTLRDLDQLSLKLIRNIGKIMDGAINKECLFGNQNFFFTSFQIGRGFEERGECLHATSTLADADTWQHFERQAERG